MANSSIGTRSGIMLIDKQLEKAETLTSRSPIGLTTEELKVWETETLDIIKRCFGTTSREVYDFGITVSNQIKSPILSPILWEFANNKSIIEKKIKILEKYKEQLETKIIIRQGEEELRQENGETEISPRLINVLEVLRLFHTSVKILQERRKGKQAFTITDEYDVQDILHCILKSQFPDILQEEHAPTVADGEKRIDLVIPKINIVIEIKVIFERGKTSKIVNELKIDIESYYTHPSCGTLVGFIYNPNTAIPDPNMIVRDLSGPRTIKGRVFDVIIQIYPQ